MDAKKEYSNGEIAIIWDPTKCIHSGNCINGLPKVFNGNRRPWIQIRDHDSDEIIEQVDKCPSGALTYRIVDPSENKYKSSSIRQKFVKKNRPPNSNKDTHNNRSKDVVDNGNQQNSGATRNFKSPISNTSQHNSNKKSNLNKPNYNKQGALGKKNNFKKDSSKDYIYNKDSKKDFKKNIDGNRFNDYRIDNSYKPNYGKYQKVEIYPKIDKSTLPVIDDDDEFLEIIEQNIPKPNTDANDGFGNKKNDLTDNIISSGNIETANASIKEDQKDDVVFPNIDDLISEIEKKNINKDKNDKVIDTLNEVKELDSEVETIQVDNDENKVVELKDKAKAKKQRGRPKKDTEPNTTPNSEIDNNHDSQFTKKLLKNKSIDQKSEQIESISVPKQLPIRIEINDNGPMLIKGIIEIKHKNGDIEVKEGNTLFCRCGESNNKPFCDGSHKRFNFDFN